MSSPDPDTTTPPRAGCAHCGLPVRGSLDAAAQNARPLFCCVGCRMAHAAAGDGGSTGLIEARLTLSAFLAMGIMTFSLVLYGEAVYGPEEDNVLRLVRNFGRIALAALSLPVLLLLAPPMLRGAWDDVRARRIRMDGLIVIAVAAAWALSVANTFHGGGEVYFDTATMVLVLVTFGRRLEAGARVHGRDAADALADCLPETAHRIADGATSEDVRPAELAPGDHVRVLPGEALPADLEVTSGNGSLRAAHLTGEETPVRFRPGDEAPAGAINGNELLEGRVLRPAGEGALGRIRELLDRPLPATRTVRLADRLAGWLAAGAIVLALVGGARSWWLGGPAEGLETALSVLLVACPCALGLATPLAFRAQRAALARRGILVHDPTALEVGGSVNHALLDKTGTLTAPATTRILGADEPETAAARLHTLVRHSGHALAGAVGDAGPPPADLRIWPGSGVSGTFDTVPCRAGSPEWMDASGLTWTPAAAAARAALSDSDVTLVAYAEGDRVQALGAVEHVLRPGSATAVATLRSLGIDVELCSGDRPEAVAALAGELHVAGQGGRTPAQKLARVEELREDGRTVLFAGDGVNDAPALRAADVGVALACGTAAARSQAQVEVLGGRIESLPALLAGARRLRQVVHGNLFWTLAYNSVALVLAVLGRLHPLVAALAMIVSSAVVSTRSYRLLGERVHREGP